MADRFYKDAAGNIGRVPEDDPEAAQRLRDQGYQPLSPEYAAQAAKADQGAAEMEGRWGPAGQAAWGFGSGLTLGLGPAASASIVGAINPEMGRMAKSDLAAMQDTSSPYFAGEVAGMLAPLVFSGGAAGEVAAGEGAIARAFGATPAGLLGRVGAGAEGLVARALPEATSALGSVGKAAAGMGARGLSEGALIGVTQAINQSIIRDQPLTAQAMLATGTDGALMGGLLGVGLGGLGAGAGRALGGALELGTEVGARAEQGSLKRVLGQIGAKAEDVARMDAEGGVRQSLKGFHDSILEPEGANFASSPSKINEIARKSVGKFEAIQQDIVKTLEKEAPQFTPDMGRVQARLAQEAVLPFQGTFSAQAVKSAVERIEGRLVGLGEAGGSRSFGTWSSWLDARRQVLTTRLVPDAEVATALRQRVLGILDSEINAGMEEAGQLTGNSGLAKQFAAASAGERMARHLEDMTAARASESASPLLGMGDFRTAAWSAALGHPLGGLGMLGAKVAGRKIQEAIAPALAQRAYELSVGAEAASAVPALRQRIGSSVSKFFDRTASAGTRAASKSAVAPKSVDAFNKTLDQTAQLASPAHAAKVQQYADSLRAMNQHALADAVQQTYQRAADYLNYNMPPSTKNAASTSLMHVPKSRSLSEDQWKFFRVDNAIKNPMSLLDGIEDGSISSEEVKAVKYVYPEMYNEVVQGVSQGILNLKQEGKFVGLEQVTQLGIILDSAVDPVLEPSFVNSIQMAIQVPEQPGPEPQRNDQIDPMNLMTPVEQTVSGVSS